MNECWNHPDAKGADFLGLIYLVISILPLLEECKDHKSKKPQMRLFCGPDGTRTRDLLRDRQAF